MKTYIVIAEENERELIDVFLTPHTKKHAKVIVTGVGGLNVIEKLSHLSKKSVIINLGYVGSNNLDVGTCLIVSKSSLYHPNVKFESPVYDLSVKGMDNSYTCFTSNDFVTFTPLKSTVVFDMELAYICALGFKEVVSFKKVSDKLNYKQHHKVASK